MIAGERYTDLIDLVRGAIDEIASGRAKEYAAGHTAFSYNNQVLADSCDFEQFDLSHAGFSKLRWPKFLKMYVDISDYWEWIESAPSITRGRESVFMAKGVKRGQITHRPGRSTRIYDGNHRWSNCLLGLTFRRTPKPVLCMYSRTSNLVGAGCLDLALASLSAKSIAERLGITQQEISFCWFSSSLQVSGLKVHPIAAGLDMFDTLKEYPAPIGRLVRKFLNGEWKTYNYSPAVRSYNSTMAILAGENTPIQVADLSVYLPPKKERKRKRDVEVL